MTRKRDQARKTLRTDAADIVEHCPAWNARRGARRITAFLDNRLAPSGFSAYQFGLMALIASAPDDTLGAIAQRADLDQSTLSRNLDALARLGWVEIVIAEQDRRKRAVWLTETGARKLEAAIPLWRAAQEDIDKILDAGLARALADQSDRLT